jgi:hypothetical protein
MVQLSPLGPHAGCDAKIRPTHYIMRQILQGADEERKGRTAESIVRVWLAPEAKVLGAGPEYFAASAQPTMKPSHD